MPEPSKKKKKILDQVLIVDVDIQAGSSFSGRKLHHIHLKAWDNDPHYWKVQFEGPKNGVACILAGNRVELAQQLRRIADTMDPQ